MHLPEQHVIQTMFEVCVVSISFSFLKYSSIPFQSIQSCEWGSGTWKQTALSHTVLLFQRRLVPWKVKDASKAIKYILNKLLVYARWLLSCYCLDNFAHHLRNKSCRKMEIFSLKEWLWPSNQILIFEISLQKLYGFCFLFRDKACKFALAFWGFFYDSKGNHEFTEIGLIYLCKQQCHKNTISGLKPIFS